MPRLRTISAIGLAALALVAAVAAVVVSAAGRSTVLAADLAWGLAGALGFGAWARSWWSDDHGWWRAGR